MYSPLSLKSVYTHPRPSAGRMNECLWNFRNIFTIRRILPSNHSQKSQEKHDMRRGIEKRNNNGVTTPIRNTGIRNASGKTPVTGTPTATTVSAPHDIGPAHGEPEQ